MLQQTRVETVVAYYLRWMANFPDLAALAAASPEEVTPSFPSSRGLICGALTIQSCPLQSFPLFTVPCGGYLTSCRERIFKKACFREIIQQS
jgi:hypothetical protein